MKKSKHEYRRLLGWAKNGFQNLKNNKNYKFEASGLFRNCIVNSTYLAHFDDAIKYGFFKYETVYENENPFKLYEKYYYIGKLTPITYKQVYRNINGKDQPIVNFKFKIESEVKDELYSYFVND